ncbi:MAG: ABC transporter permease [SAR202 cluster bacterium]|nr:ABC transporter permease [Dehalococcoidia bacterium]MQG47372.1 ABC transporter permease [SAR202 cluster bacterium]
MDQDNNFESRVSVASQRQLIWWRFTKHKLAVISAILLIILYLTTTFAEFFATAHPLESEAFRGLMPPQPIHFFDEGKLSPHVCAMIGTRDTYTYKKTYEPNCDEKTPVKFFVKGFEYKWLNLIPMDRHLIGVPEGYLAEEHIFILGTDILGRDMWSRIWVASRLSLSIGLVGVILTLFFGITLGGISGFYGGFIDTIIQRIIEIVRAVPTIPLWMALAAAMPFSWSIVQIYFSITLIISLFAWTDLARVVRGRFLSLREEDFVTAAVLSGADEKRIIFRHVMPSLYSHIIAAVSLAIPLMIISETALSFLGLGLQAPAISWGTLLQGTQNVQSVALYKWLMIPAFPVVGSILLFNFLGDGLRDAADPYSD